MAATRRQDVDADTWWVPLARVLAIAHPLDTPPWCVDRISVDDVLTEVADPTMCDHEEKGCRACEIRRIAWFVTHDVEPDDPHPIVIDLGMEGYVPSWPIEDGNHRVAALAVMGASLVPVQVCGDVDRAAAVLLEGKNLFDEVVRYW